MECTNYRELMIEVLYGEAPAEAAARFEEHLAECGGCREELAAFRRVSAELKSDVLPALHPPARRTRLAAWPRGLVAAAAVALLALGAGFSRLVQLERRLTLQEARHAQEIAALESALNERGASQPAAVAGSDGFERFEALLRESESRQSRRVEESLRKLAERTEAQRRYDLARVSAGLAYLDGRTGQHVARTTELMGHVLQVAEKK